MLGVSGVRRWFSECVSYPAPLSFQEKQNKKRREKSIFCEVSDIDVYWILSNFYVKV